MSDMEFIINNGNIILLSVFLFILSMLIRLLFWVVENTNKIKINKFCEIMKTYGFICLQFAIGVSVLIGIIYGSNVKIIKELKALKASGLYAVIYVGISFIALYLIMCLACWIAENIHKDKIAKFYKLINGLGFFCLYFVIISSVVHVIGIKLYNTFIVFLLTTVIFICHLYNKKIKVEKLNERKK